MIVRTTSSSWAQGIVQSLESAGVDCRQLFGELGLDYSALSDPDARFAQDDMTRLWQRAVAVSGNPAIGLDMARQVRPAALNVVGYALMSSRNLKEGFARLVRYQRIIAEGADLDFQPCAEGYRLSLTILGDRLPPARQSAEGSLAGCLTFCRWLSGTMLRPILLACREGLRLESEYVSLANPEVEIRVMAPHTLVFTGMRWHVRAYCEKNREYRDFVLSRFRGEPDLMDESEHIREQDEAWNTPGPMPRCARCAPRSRS